MTLILHPGDMPGLGNDREGSNLSFRHEARKVGNRRISPIPARPDEGLLSDLRADAQRAQRELVIVPRSRIPHGRNELFDDFVGRSE